MARLGFITDELSDEAKRIMADGFAANRAALAIADAISDATGEQVSERTIARRAKEWREERDRRKVARERMQDLVDALRTGDTNASEMVQALAMEALESNPEALTMADPVRFQRLGLQAEELRLKRRQIEVRERAIAVVEKKLAILEAREARVIETLSEDKGESMTAEERVRRAREIYGLAS